MSALKYRHRQTSGQLKLLLLYPLPSRSLSENAFYPDSSLFPKK